ncbi:MAG: exodeoxyribonuclease III [Bacillota bacterium]
MRIISWNVNGIRAIAGKGFIEWIRSDDPDILCVQETKAHIGQLPAELTDLEGYYGYFAESERKGYSGVGLYSKDEPLEVDDSFGAPQFDGEGRVLVARYPDFVLLNVYFPNGKRSAERLRYKMDFYAEFLDFLGSLLREGDSVILCGDVNTAHRQIDLARPDENVNVSGFLPEERAWIDELVAAGFTDTFRMFDDGEGNYTFWSYITRARQRNVGWRLDYVFVSDDLKDRVEDAFILSDVRGSDHCPVGIEVRGLAE